MITASGVDRIIITGKDEQANDKKDGWI